MSGKPINNNGSSATNVGAVNKPKKVHPCSRPATPNTSGSMTTISPQTSPTSSSNLTPQDHLQIAHKVLDECIKVSVYYYGLINPNSYAI